MKNYIKHDPWCIIEEGFHPEYNEITESLCSLGNGRMGQRGNFEEDFTGKTLQGNYVAGVYYPDKTRVGWWKNGYPEYFAKVLNAANWTGLHIWVDGELVDLNKATVIDFNRCLNMQEGILYRKCTIRLTSGKKISIQSQRLNSIVDDEAGAINYQISPLGFSATIKVESYIDGDIKNKDSNYDEKFWNAVGTKVENNLAIIELSTKKTNFHVATGQITTVSLNDAPLTISSENTNSEKYVSNTFKIEVPDSQILTINKYAVNLSSENHQKVQMINHSVQYLKKFSEKGYKNIKKEQIEAWAAKWAHNDIIIEGDIAAQQGIRFNIFQLNQTYTGEDARLNIGPKGFTGEKYGGSTYWDTEAYCIPFYLSTAAQQVSRNLLIYRWKQLGKAIENAEKLGFTAGAALYPMVTMNGEECHNEWEITFEEIHRNGAIAYAIHDYVRYTGDAQYLVDYGLEVLLGIARFWVQRVHWSEYRKQYVMLGVTGPNEYENNINNNWYTNYIAKWCINYCLQVADYVKVTDNAKYQDLVLQTKLNEAVEFAQMKNVAENMYFPESKELGIFLQQDGFLDKEQVTVEDLRPEDRPLNQKWSWDRILRSPFIKQADVLQGLYFFEEDFDIETIRRNYDYYEPRTVHESSLSPCVHSILAAKLGDKDDSYRFYNRAARLDLDDYNNDTEDGLHITSMAGTWMSVVKGFGGMRIKDNQLIFNPFLPSHWKSFAFKIGFRDAILSVKTTDDWVEIENKSTHAVHVNVYNERYEIKANQTIKVEQKDLVV